LLPVKTSNTPAIKTIAKNSIIDIRCWIILFFLLRLYGVTDPPLEIAHNWRQVTGNMIARNFYETDNNIFFPRLDMAGDKTGITGTEFPTLNYFTYLLSLVFGFHDWFGRLINLIISSLGVFYFYKLLKLKFEKRLSFFAAYFLLVSDWLIYSRKAMPDTFSVSLVIMSLYFAFRYFEDQKWKDILAYFFLAMIGVLSKIPAAFLLVLLITPVLDKQIPVHIRLYVVCASIALLIPVCIWYFYWVPYLIQEFGFAHYYMGIGVQLGFHQLITSLSQVFEKFYYDALKFIGFAAFIAGLFIAYQRREKQLMDIFSKTGIAFFLFMLKAGGNFSLHSYYIIPFVPIICLFAAYAITRIRKEWMMIIVVMAITAENIANQQHDFHIKESEKYKLSYERIADKVCKSNDLVAINCGENPQQIYLLHRKGWTITSEQATDNAFLQRLDIHHCKYLFINKHIMSKQPVVPPLECVYDDQDIAVYRLYK
jgi:4-amino-4-deoxy-L-arabinose transferase-like glycosyltransferase